MGIHVDEFFTRFVRRFACGVVRGIERGISLFGCLALCARDLIGGVL
jgi:hypothetical protein